MDFGDILDQWDKNKKTKPQKKKDDFNQVLDQYLPGDEIINQKNRDEQGSQEFLSTRALNKMKIDKSCDLHGLTLAQAVQKADDFIHQCHRLGCKKILFIHGKGNHSLSDPVLQKEIRRFIQNHELAGRWGVADKKNGGNGATWALLRYRSR